MNARRKQYVRLKAFTLLELILVMIILCTVLAMAAPSLAGFFSSRQVSDVAEHILVMTRYAKVQAIFSSNIYRIYFDPMKRRYWVSSLSESEYERLENGYGNYYPMPTDIEFEFEDVEKDGGTYYLQFDPKGYSRESRIRLLDERGNELEIICRSPSENYEVLKIHNGEEYEL